MLFQELQTIISAMSRTVKHVF